MSTTTIKPKKENLYDKFLEEVKIDISDTINTIDAINNNKNVLEDKKQLTIRQSNGLSIEQLDRPNIIEQTIRQTIRQTDEQTVRQTIRQTDENNICIDYDNPVWTLTEKHGEILKFLYFKTNKITRLNEIVENTGIPYGTIRYGIRVLLKLNFISKIKNFYKGGFQGFTYIMNDKLCSDYLKIRQTVRQTVRQTDQKSVSIADQLADTSSSTYLNKKNTTTTNVKAFENVLKNEPELGYWREKNLTAKQAKEWCFKFNISEILIIEYLKYCRFDMVDNKQEEEKKIDNVLNWFFRIIERTGSYPKPKYYKSFEEKRLEEEEIIISSKKELYEKKKAQEIEKFFLEMMSKPDGEEYQKCYSKLPEIFKSNKSKLSTLFENSMKEAFIKLIN